MPTDSDDFGETADMTDAEIEPKHATNTKSATPGERTVKMPIVRSSVVTLRLSAQGQLFTLIPESDSSPLAVLHRLEINHFPWPVLTCQHSPT